ncbi:MAG: hypothetical protein QXY61_02130 [Candidatus Anstonellales archaeon]
MDLSYINSVLLSSEFAYFLVSAVSLAFYAYLIFFFYKKLARRDISVFNETESERGILAIVKKTISELSFLIKTLVLTPLYVFLWAFFIAVMIVFLTREHDINYAILVSALLVSTTRILAYINEEVSMEVGKLIPLVFLATILLDPSILLSAPVDIEKAFFAVMSSAPKIAIFMIAVELLLRFMYETIRILRFLFGMKR